LLHGHGLGDHVNYWDLVSIVDNLSLYCSV